MKKVILIISMALLYFGNYHICEYFFKDDIDMWWTCKGAIYNAVIVIGLHLASLDATLKQMLLISIFSGVIVNNIIDRLWFKSIYYEWDDIIIIIVIFTLSYIEYKWLRGKKNLPKKI